MLCRKTGSDRQVDRYNIFYICCRILQLPPTARTVSDQTLEPRTQSGSLTRMSGTQVFESSSAASYGVWGQDRRELLWQGLQVSQAITWLLCQMPVISWQTLSRTQIASSTSSPTGIINESSYFLCFIFKHRKNPKVIKQPK